MTNQATPMVARPLTRRNVLRGGALSASAVGLMACAPALATGGTSAMAENDVAILNVALALEHEAIDAYQIGAESGLLSDAVLPVAVSFQSHHKEHRDALVATIEMLGGTAVAPRSREEYAEGLNVAALTSQGDVLDLAATLELGAANAYLGVIPAFDSSDLAQVSARLAADEAMHWTALTQALGRPLPTLGLTFGA